MAWNALRWAPDDAVVKEIEFFTDGAADYTQTWPRTASSAGWGVVVMAPLRTGDTGWRLHLVGATFGPVVTIEGEPAYLGAARPTSPCAEVTAALAALKLTHHRAPAGDTPITLRPDSMQVLVRFAAAARANRCL
eukprot:10788765-Lingulodinium_polyedra.AAC.1